MRKSYFLFLAIFATANMYAQTYTISFAATGSTSILDSGKVENLTHPETVKWYSGDVLHLLSVLTINNVGLNEENIQVYPNPMQGQAKISFYAKQAGNALISIHDIAGKVVLKTQERVLHGNQKYGLTGLKQGVYIIKINGDGYFYSAKLISLNPASDIAKIKQLGNENTETNTNTQKSSNAIVNMNYTTGDTLRFTGYSGSLKSVVNDAPEDSKTITFNYIGNSCGQLLTDSRDGNVYTSVQIGSQCWMAENLKYLPAVFGLDTVSSTTKLYYVYGYDGTIVADAKLAPNYAIYGVLYNWTAAMNGEASSTSNPSNVQGVCPSGWHLPSADECRQLSDYLGGETIAGGKLKETGTSHWASPNTGATNESGFTALPGGFRYHLSGIFLDIGYYGFFWCATASETNANDLEFNNNEDDADLNNNDKTMGFSVRCLRD